MTDPMTDAVTAAPDDLPVPYLPFDTFKNFIEALSGRPLPPRVDRSLMMGMAGGTQTLLLSALVTFQLIGEDRTVLPAMRELVRADSEERQRLMAALLHRMYPEPMMLARQHATADQLAESFRVRSGYQGSTLRKAITFYLNMAKYAQVELSPFFRAPAQIPSGRKAASRSRAAATGARSPSAGSEAPPTQPLESRSVELISGGTVTVSCSVSFLSLSREDREFVFDLVDRIDGYRDRRAEPPTDDPRPEPRA